MNKKIMFLVCASENPQVIAQVQRRCFSEKFRNFVDLCVLKNYECRAGTQQLLHHSYLKKMKLNSCLGTFQMSIVSDGLVELQKKVQKFHNIEHYTTNNIQTNKNIIWNFD